MVRRKSGSLKLDIHITLASSEIQIQDVWLAIKCATITLQEPLVINTILRNF